MRPRRIPGASAPGNRPPGDPRPRVRHRRDGPLARATAGRPAALDPARPRRRPAEGRRRLGPDAVALAVEEFGRLRAEVLVRPSPWRLGATQASLAAEWFTGWRRAACEQQVELAAETDAYARRRLTQATAGQLEVTVDH